MVVTTLLEVRKPLKTDDPLTVRAERSRVESFGSRWMVFLRCSHAR